MSRHNDRACGLGGVALAIYVLTSAGASAAAGPAQGYVAAPVEVVERPVALPQTVLLPWSGVSSCSAPAAPGCLAVERTAPGAVGARFQQFTIKDGALRPSGLYYTVEITNAGTPYPLFTIENGDETYWIYAALASPPGNTTAIRFLKLRGFVSEAATLLWEIVLDETSGFYRETTRVETSVPLSLVGLRGIGRVLPGGRLTTVRVDEELVHFPYENIRNLNFPPGTYTIVAEAIWQPEKGSSMCLGPAYEGRKMSLPRRTNLRIASDKKTTVTLRPIGLPATLWRKREILFSADPKPSAQRVDDRAMRLVFDGSAEVSLLPVIMHEKATFPVLTCIVFGETALRSTD